MGDPTPARLTESRRFPLNAATPGRVRAYLGTVARLDRMRRAEAELLVTELVANSLRHAEVESIEVSVTPKGHVVQIGVTHEADDPIEIGEAGFGFTLLDRLSQEWGVQHQEAELTVWFEVRAPGAMSISPETLSDEDLLAGLADHPLFADELVRRYEPLASSIARRYRGKGIAEEDLHQVALIALMKSIHRYDPTRGELRSFAAVTISGELKRQLRDRGWSVHVPRGLQERAMAVSSAIEQTTQSSGRVPSVSELSEVMGLEVEEIAEAMSVVHGYRAVSLDADLNDHQAPIELLGEVDASITGAAVRTSIDEALLTLPERERLIVYLRFYEDMTQSQIAEAVGISQMHVSRLLSKSLEELNDLLADD